VIVVGNGGGAGFNPAGIATDGAERAAEMEKGAGRPMAVARLHPICLPANKLSEIPAKIASECREQCLTGR